MKGPWVGLVVLVLASCGGPAQRWAGRITEVDGVLRVENPATPLAGPGEVRPVRLWSRAGPARGDVWEAPNRLHVHDGIAFVVDRMASRIHRVTTAGMPLPSFGSAGTGPGQYRRITDAIPTDSGLFVIDVGNARVEVLSDSGVALSTVALDRFALSAAALGSGAIALNGLAGDVPGWTRVAADGAMRPLNFPDFPMSAPVEGPISSGSTWGDRLVRLRYTMPAVHVFSAGGVLEREVVIPLPVELAGDDEIADVIRDATSTLLQQGLPADAIDRVAASIRDWPREKKRFRKIDFDDETRLAAIWEQNPEDFGSGPATLHVLSPDGVYLAVVSFDRAWSDFDLEGGVLYCLARDPDTDLVELEAYQLSVAPSLLDRARAIAGSVASVPHGDGP